ncbi:MAG: hypothetical protein N2378_08295 [Chloroflexaceae bacterium]|nr:hypothetical protein [Chloroflexaceae bacterium]
MYSPTDMLFVIVGTAVITAFIVAVLMRNVTSYRPPDVIYVPPQSEDAGSGCLAILILLGMLVFIVFTFGS